MMIAMQSPFCEIKTPYSFLLYGTNNIKSIVSVLIFIVQYPNFNNVFRKIKAYLLLQAANWIISLFKKDQQCKIK